MLLHVFKNKTPQVSLASRVSEDDGLRRSFKGTGKKDAKTQRRASQSHEVMMKEGKRERKTRTRNTTEYLTGIKREKETRKI